MPENKKPASGVASAASLRPNEQSTSSVLPNTLQQQQQQQQNPSARTNKVYPAPSQQQQQHQGTGTAAGGVRRTRSLSRRIILQENLQQTQELLGNLPANPAGPYPTAFEVGRAVHPVASPLSAPTGRWWIILSRLLTIWAPSFLLRRASHSFSDDNTIQAWREKVSLCIIFGTTCLVLAFITLGLQKVLCSGISSTIVLSDGSAIPKGITRLRASLYNMTAPPSAIYAAHGAALSNSILTGLAGKPTSGAFAIDAGALFPLPSSYGCPQKLLNLFPCAMASVPGQSHCHANSNPSSLSPAFIGEVRYTWDRFKQLASSDGQSKLLVYNGYVVDLAPYFALGGNKTMGGSIDSALSSAIGTDISMLAASNADLNTFLYCISNYLSIAFIDITTPGCIASQIVLYLSLFIILGIVLARFFIAVTFDWFLSWKLGDLVKTREKLNANKTTLTRQKNNNGSTNNVNSETAGAGRQKRSSTLGLYGGSNNELQRGSNSNLGGSQSQLTMAAVSEIARAGRLNTDPQHIPPPSFTSNSHVRGASAPADPVNRRLSSTFSNNNLAAIPSNGSIATTDSFPTLQKNVNGSQSNPQYNNDALRPYYTVVLVTCYSEGEESMRATLDSVAGTTFEDSQKLLFIVADGIITGSGNAKSTPDIVLGMMEEVHVEDPGLRQLRIRASLSASSSSSTGNLNGSTQQPGAGSRENLVATYTPPQPMSYVAIADGAKRHNMARVHVGFYNYQTHRVPMVVIVKCGAPSEQGAAKPGNRGKRDGQIILMDFFSKIMFNDRLSPLQFELYYKLRALTRVDPCLYEICLMVDADTKVHPESLSRMVAVMAQDPLVMGLCGETRIENKAQTWVTRIQVFEYYISHHLGKAFESVFGGVTCLPGCFCMYRLKVRRKSDEHMVPIICSPTIIQQYAENIVDTLHKKNLLSLGEDRFLSSLMLRAFPRRKMMFVPRALCRTVVPHTMSMLLSQRRRWINSTIHNLFELALVRELCGTFCFSMQFVVILELIGTITLPIAIILTLTLIFVTIFGDVQLIPLILLLCILGLPAVLILLTTRKLSYLYWMLIYLASLPIWNFVLPVYAFWHFDDFSWGETRMVAGESKQADHSKREGNFDGSLVPQRTMAGWVQYYAEIASQKISNPLQQKPQQQQQ